jgi:hypothetical protein
MKRQWSVEDEEVKAALSGVIKSGTGSYYKMVGKRCVTFRASQALKDLGMCGGIAARLLARFPMPVIPFRHNRNRTVLTEEQLIARQKSKEERALAKAMEAVSISDGPRGNSFQGVTPETKAIRDVAVMKEDGAPIGAPSQPSTVTTDSPSSKICEDEPSVLVTHPAPDGDDEDGKATKAEEKENRRYQIEKTSSGYYGVHDSVSNNTRLTGRTRQSALDEIELMREHSEVFHWYSIRNRSEIE